MTSTRHELLVLLRKRPGSTAGDLAAALSLSAVAVRRHLENLASDGFVERVAPAPTPRGRPPSAWRLTPAGVEQFPRRYGELALELLDDLADEGGPEAVQAVVARRTEKLAAEYEAELAGATDLGDRVRRIATLRDDAGYAAQCVAGEDGDLLLVENNCAVQRVAERHSTLCSMELVLLRRVLGPEAEVTRVAHTMTGDPVCCYRVRPRNPEDGSGQ